MDRPLQPPLYARQLEAIRQTQVYKMNINCQHLAMHPGCRTLYQQLIRYPQEIVPIMDLVVHQEFLQQRGDPVADEAAMGGHRIQVRPFNLQDVHKLRNLDPSNIDQLVAITGMVTRVSPVIPDLKQGYFRCTVCSHEKEVMIDRGRIDEPTSCENCSAKLSMEMVHNRCLFSDKQMIRLQETPDEIPEGETPQAVTLFGFDDLVDAKRILREIRLMRCFDHPNVVSLYDVIVPSTGGRSHRVVGLNRRLAACDAPSGVAQQAR